MSFAGTVLRVPSSCDHNLSQLLLLLTIGHHLSGPEQPGVVNSGQAQHTTVSCCLALT